MKKPEYIAPNEIEKRSFEIITKELEEKGITLDERYDYIIKRCIHTTADFEYVDSLRFSEGAVDKLKKLIREGAFVVTDTNMAFSGINKTALLKYGGEIKCYMSDPDLCKIAIDGGVTRASLAMKKAASLYENVIFVVGNAPTALITLRELYDKGYKPAFIIGVPVGFVNVEVSKELIMETDIPYIINYGRKGGSNVAASIVNAVVYDMKKEDMETI